QFSWTRTFSRCPATSFWSERKSARCRVSQVKKRFIAGAVCPQCSTADSIVMYKENNDEYRECVDCGFQEKLVFKQQHRELETRVNTTEQQVAAEIQVIQFPPPDKNDKNQ